MHELKTGFIDWSRSIVWKHCHRNDLTQYIIEGTLVSLPILEEIRKFPSLFLTLEISTILLIFNCT